MGAYSALQLMMPIVLKHKANSIHIDDLIISILAQIHTELLQL